MKNHPSPSSVMPFSFPSKGETLERLSAHVTQARLCEQIVVAVSEWRERRETVINEIVDRFGPLRLAVRSSAANEDGWNDSQAGVHLSLMNVESVPDTLARAVDTDLLMEMILMGHAVHAVVIEGGWLEIDTADDYEKALALIADGTIVRFFVPGIG